MLSNCPYFHNWTSMLLIDSTLRFEDANIHLNNEVRNLLLQINHELRELKVVIYMLFLLENKLTVDINEEKLDLVNNSS